MSTAKAIGLMVGGALVWIIGSAIVEARAEERNKHKPRWTDAARWER